LALPHELIDPWKLALSPDVNVERMPEGSVYVEYSGEKTRVPVWRYSDYLHPVGVRFDGRSLYLITGGLAGGLYRSSELVQYDVARRRIVHSRTLAAEDVEPLRSPRK
jgi:hypothetical protein